MTPCHRGCCWTPFSCATNRSCTCHEDEQSGGRRGIAYTHADPTASQAIGNIMKERKT